MVKLIVCDIDNTIVPKQKMPSERTVKCIQEFEDRGIYFGLASGRNIEYLQALTDKWNLYTDILIGSNGAEYYDALSGEYYALDKLKKEQIKEIFDIMEPFKEVTNASIMLNNQKYIRRYDERAKASYNYLNPKAKPIVVEDDSFFWSQEVFKVEFRTKEEYMDAIEKRASEFPSKYYRGFKTESTNYEFSIIDADKGKCLKRFCKTHNIDLKDTYAFGDTTNDINLLEVAGHSVCLKNGSDDAKAIADEVTDLPIAEDGFADYVEKHILNK